MNKLKGAMAFAAVVLVAAINYAVWECYRPPEPALRQIAHLHGVSYSPFQADESPFDRRFPTQIEMAQDMKLLAGKVDVVRTYSCANGFDQIPVLAGRYGIKVMLGAWLNSEDDPGKTAQENHNEALANQREIASLVRAAKANRNVIAVIVGNETLLRGPSANGLTERQLINYIRSVKGQVDVPVSTAEPYHVWLKHPRVAAECDFIAAHFLPYWEGVPIEKGVEHVVATYDQLQKAYPDQRIVMAEVGWPSGGWRYEAAMPTPANQEQFTRAFMTVAEDRGLEYCMMEAFDQPWKGNEGWVGPHWGLWNSDRTEKFAWAQASFLRVGWDLQAAVAAGLGLALMLAFAMARQDVTAEGVLFFSLVTQAAVSASVYGGFLFFDRSLGDGTRWALVVLWPAQVVMLLVMVANAFEMTELLWQRYRLRLFQPLRHPPAAEPMVSIHVPVCREPAEMVAKTLASLAALRYSNYEVLVISNNTPDESLWRPVRALCEKLGPRFRFFNLENWPGYKAGALNFALRQTDPQAGIIAVIDSDYVVEPDWLAATVGYFDKGSVAVVQGPQDNRGWRGRPFKELLNAEYSGFFHLGMVHRNERNAIIQHGTMSLIRRASLEQAGGWGEWCICEDADLGLRLMAAGLETVYINHSFGRGVVPESFFAYKRQRQRWAYGAVQIMRHHWRTLIWGSQGQLTRWQRYHYIAGWLPWLGDAVGLVFVFGSIVWTAGLLLWPHGVGLPLPAMVIPVIGVAAFNLIRTYWLYQALVPCKLTQRLAACVGGLGLFYTIGRACLAGMTSDDLPFMRTPKGAGGGSVRACISAVRAELTLLALLLAAMLGMVALIHLHDLGQLLSFVMPTADTWGDFYSGTRSQAWLWVIALGAQALPLAASVGCSLLGGMPLFDAASVRLSIRRAQSFARRTLGWVPLALGFVRQEW